MERTILHCDCNSFYASVECLLNPSLREVPMAVAGDSASRHGIILAKNEAAKKYGIVTAEPVSRALNKCPDLITVPPRHELYEHYSDMINEIYLEYTDLAEKFGIDETWLDVTGSRGLFGDGREIAEILRKRIKKEIGITISVGVSFNKIFAKLGSDYKKPDAVTVIPREKYKEIVFPMPVESLLFVGKKTLSVLKRMYINTIGELAAADKRILSEKLGKLGEMLHIYANGEDNEPVKSAYAEREVKSVGKGKTFPADISAKEEIRREIYILSDTVAAGLRKNGLKCTVVQLHVKDARFNVKSRQKSLIRPTFIANEIASCAEELFDELQFSENPVRALTVTAANLINSDFAEQLVLSENSVYKKEKLEYTVDRLRSLYGSEIIVRGAFLLSNKNEV